MLRGTFHNEPVAVKKARIGTHQVLGAAGQSGGAGGWELHYIAPTMNAIALG